MKLVYINGQMKPVVLGSVNYIYDDEINYEKTRQALTGKFVFLHFPFKWAVRKNPIYDKLWKKTILNYIYYFMFIIKQYNICISSSFLGGEDFDTLLFSSYHLFRKNDIIFIATPSNFDDDIRFLYEFYSSCINSGKEKKAVFIVLYRH